MAGYHRMKLFSLFCILTLAANVFAQPVDANASILQDSLVTDSLSKISLANDVDTNTIVNTNKVESVDAGVSQNLDSVDVINPYYPSGFTIEAAYAGPTILQLRLFGGRENPHELFKNKWISFGFAVGYLDIDFQRGFISDDCLFMFLISLMGRTETFESFWVVLASVVNGNTYLSLTENARIGLFETHHFVDYLFSGLSSSYGWEFGWSQAMGVRFVLSKSAYLDLGGHVEITNQRFLFGAFVQLGIFGGHK
jgi:hypothetical protein